MIVLDASAAVELLMRSKRGRILAARLVRDQPDLHVPQLIDLEVTQVLRKLIARAELSDARASQALDGLRALRLRRYAHEPLLTRIWSLRNNLSAYDAAYVALAESLSAPLLTTDVRLASASGHRARVEVIS